jgi:DNA polymerase elongation subunit (family B)
VEKEKYTDDERLAIHIWCLDEKSQPHFVRIENFPVLCYLELPKTIWSRDPNQNTIKTQKLVSYLHWKLRKADHEPIGHRLEYRRRVYYFTNEGELPMLKLQFKNLDSLRHCRNVVKYPIRLKGYPEFKCKIWEYDIGPIRKMLTHRGMTYSQPFYIEAKPVEEALKLTDMEHEYIGDWKTMVAVPSEEADKMQLYPKIIAFDIECYSDDKKMFPNEWNVPHVAYMVSLIYQVFKKPETRERYAVILGPCGNIPSSRLEGVVVYNVKSEKRLVDKMAEIILMKDVEIISGYNIFGFDYKYLHRRLTQKLHEWPRMGKIVDEKAVMKSNAWSSGVYGHNAIFDLKMAGRINIDLLPIIKRDHKLMKYSLDFVANHFLGSHKHDITAADMFWIYEELQDAEKRLHGIKDQCGATDVLERAISDYETLFENYFYQPKTVVFDLYQRYEKWILDGGIEAIESKEESEHYQLVDLERWRQITERLLDESQAHSKVWFVDCVTRYVLARLMMAFVLLYCLQDSDLVIDLFDRLNTFVGLV